METTQNNKKILMISGLVALLIVLIIIYLVFRPKKNIQQADIQPTSIPTPTTVFIPSPTLPEQQRGPAAGETTYQIDTSTENQLEAVGNLSKLVPYKGQYFSIEYVASSGNYVVTIQQVNKSQGDLEFDNFLKTNNIKMREWIPNLSVIYQ